MQLAPGAVTHFKTTNGELVVQTEQDLKNGTLVPVFDAWFTLDGEAEQEVHVQQPHAVSKPFLGPIDTMLLAGLIVATFVHHTLRGSPKTKA